MNITIPIKILTKKISRTRTDSFFYAGKSIAKVTIANRQYVLTTAGQYKFSLEGKAHSFESTDWIPNTIRHLQRKLTDKKLDAINEDVSNWGWFGINVWVESKEGPQCLPTPTECYSRYDEALKAFKEYVEQDLKGQAKVR
jgi:hypothetical protein